MITYNVTCVCSICLSVCSFVNSLKQKNAPDHKTERKVYRVFLDYSNTM